MKSAHFPHSRVFLGGFQRLSNCVLRQFWRVIMQMVGFRSAKGRSSQFFSESPNNIASRYRTAWHTVKIIARRWSSAIETHPLKVYSICQRETEEDFRHIWKNFSPIGRPRLHTVTLIEDFWGRNVATSLRCCIEKKLSVTILNIL